MELLSSWNYPRLSSPFSRIYLIEEGEAIVRHSGEEHHLKAGDLHLVPCHVTADYSCPKRQVQYFVGFSMRLTEGSDLFAVRRCDLTLKASDLHYTIFNQLIEITNQVATKTGRLNEFEMSLSQKIAARGLVMQLASSFLETVHNLSEYEIEMEGRFAPILQFIDDNLRRDISLETLADLAGLTPTYFSDLFSKTLEIRPIEFVNRRRIERAQLLLCSTDLTIQEVAEEVGINSPTYFSRLFLKITGVAPRSYRKLILGI